MSDLLKRLSEVIGVSGDEGAVRRLILREIKDHVEDIQIDPMGSVLAVKRGTGASDLRVMVAAHMDEVGFMVMGHDSDGSIRFSAVGGIDARILPGLRVQVGPDAVPGLIAWTPIHLNRGQDTVTIDRLRIDVGVSSREAAQKIAHVGDRIAFYSEYTELGGADWPTVRGKAFDDRAGCASLVKLVQGDPLPFDVFVAFTVQEEVGLRGAKVAAQRIEPDAAFVLETTACHDLPQAPDEPDDQPDQTTITQLGGGTVINVVDRSMIGYPPLVRFLVDTADRHDIPHQFRSPQFAGGTDAGRIHLSGTGVPSVVISTPCRYLHGPHTVMHLGDWAHQHDLLRAALQELTPAVLGR